MATTLLQFDADAFQLPTSSAPERNIVQNRPYVGFDADAVETVYTKPSVMPQQYSAGVLTAYVAYMMASATSGTVNFEVSVEAVTDGDAVDLDAGTSFDTANSATETVPGTAGYLSVLAVTLTNKDSVAAGDLVTFKLERDADDAGADDSATGDARVLWMEIREG